jgi:uncharacterized phage-like protein YoqJ
MLIELGNMKEDYEKLKETIVSLYHSPFELWIETKQISNVSIFMAIDFAFFLNELKKKELPYLQHTTIHVYSEFIYNILYQLFTYLSRPIAPVEVIFFEEEKIKYIKTFYP